LRVCERSTVDQQYTRQVVMFMLITINVFCVMHAYKLL